MPRQDDEQQKIWYLAGPFYRYAEDVKRLARKAGLVIIDATVTEDRTDAAPAKDCPRVTVKPEYAELSDEEKAAADLARSLTQQQ